MLHSQIEEKVLKRITPTKTYHDKIKKISEEIEIILKKEIEKRKLPAKIKLVGSIAKDTYLMDNMDIDYFLIFPRNFSKKDISKSAINIGKSFLNDTEESYAEHPYIRGYYKKYNVEVVPCYKISDATDRISAVDRTPLHTKYVIKNLKEDKKKEVRLFKQFLKGIECYGAEAQIQGFSGYLCELLIIKHKFFRNLLSEAENWNHGIKFAMKEGKYPNFNTPLVFIDPVDSNRNVSSALSKDKFLLFKKACTDYNHESKITFFFPNQIKPWNINKIKKKISNKNSNFIGIKIELPSIIDENLYPQIRKAKKSIWDNCQRYGFKLFDISFTINKKQKQLYYILKIPKEKISETYIHQGPPIKKSNNVNAFIEKWENDKRLVKGPYKDDKRIYVKIKREYTDLIDFLNNNLKSWSMGKDIDKSIEKGVRFLKSKDLIKDPLRIFWTRYLDGKMTWER